MRKHFSCRTQPNAYNNIYYDNVTINCKISQTLWKLRTNRIYTMRIKLNV